MRPSHHLAAFLTADTSKSTDGTPTTGTLLPFILSTSLKHFLLPIFTAGVETRRHTRERKCVFTEHDTD